MQRTLIDSIQNIWSHAGNKEDQAGRIGMAQASNRIIVVGGGIGGLAASLALTLHASAFLGEI